MKPLNITCHISSDDAKLFKRVIDMGIDAHLEAFTRSTFNVIDHLGFPKVRLDMNFDASEVPILIRRLEEIGTEESLQWVEDIKENAPEYFA